MSLYKRSLLLTAVIPLLLGLNGFVFLAFEEVDEGTSEDEADFLEYMDFPNNEFYWIDFVTYKCENND